MWAYLQKHRLAHFSHFIFSSFLVSRKHNKQKFFFSKYHTDHKIDNHRIICVSGHRKKEIENIKAYILILLGTTKSKYKENHFFCVQQKS